MQKLKIEPDKCSEVNNSSDVIKHKIYVSNLEWSVHENLLKHFLSKFGSVKRCKILRFQDTNRSKGIAFVELNDAQSAENVLNAQENDLVLCGRPLIVKMYEKNSITKPKYQEKYIQKQVTGSSSSQIDYQPSRCYLDMLPYNVLNNIFSYFSIRDLCIAEQVCRRWYEIARLTWSQKERLVLNNRCIFENYCFKKDNQYGFVCRPDFGKTAILQILNKNLRNLKYFDISECYSKFGTTIGEILRYLGDTCPKLTHLLLNNLSVSNKNFTPLVKRCANLKVIKISNSHRLSDASISKIFQHCPLLEEFDFSNCRIISGECFQRIKPNNQKIQRVYLNDCEKLKGSYLEILLTRCTNIKKLSLKRNEPYSSITIRCIVYNSPRLESLFLSPNGFDSLLSYDLQTIEFEKFENLRELDIGRSHCNNDLVTCLLQKLSNLKILIIDQCINLVDDPFACPNIKTPLEELNLNFNKYITDECIQSLVKFSSTMRILKIKGCSRLSDQAIKQILERLDKLSYLDVSLNNAADNSLLEAALWHSPRKIHISCNDSKVDPNKFIFDHPETIKTPRDRDCPLFEIKNLTFESLMTPIRRVADENVWNENGMLYIGPPIDSDYDEDYDFEGYYEENDLDQENELEELLEPENEMFKEI
ncbi:RNA-binding isoform X1 [Brachionus plicatilis]|uniref:RNA-binding isoform X1 n=1 Tax=Brachionus plicatilis TaxID=10195 RepID=A0A3M7R9Z1_BRAPC|nr:RNA-binding isoform X1 [Brachionus plicatilis]